MFRMQCMNEGLGGRASVLLINVYDVVLQHNQIPNLVYEQLICLFYPIRHCVSFNIYLPQQIRCGVCNLTKCKYDNAIVSCWIDSMIRPSLVGFDVQCK